MSRVFYRFRRIVAAALGVLVALPAIAGQISSADDFDLDSYAGEVVYLDFWASWCAPCKASFPWMDSMQQRYADAGLHVLAVNVDAEPEAAERFLATFVPEFDVVMDPDGVLASRYKIETMPSSFLIGRNGELISSHKGFRDSDREKMEIGIQQALSRVQVTELMQ
ncbi:MAG: TlpA disulfide reductase family protein [Pseudomonadota bacterium]|nr:TlpA disulfide reductase family protein [Pseudomonadota bacterium]